MRQWLTTNSKNSHKQVIGKGGERELILIALYDCLWNVADEDCMNMNSTKKEEAYCQINAQVPGEYGITRDYS